MKNTWIVIFSALWLASAFAVSAAPLPTGTLLKIDPGVGSAPNYPCPYGSCFGFEAAPGFYIWIDFGPGSDGGLIVGKAQACGGQESGPSQSNSTSGEMSAAFPYFNYATLCTAPGGEQNIFDDTACAGADCLGKTDVKYLYLARNGEFLSLGSSGGCTHAKCSSAQQSGIFINHYSSDPATGGWILDYSQVIPSGETVGYRVRILLRGKMAPNVPPVAKDISVGFFTSGIEGYWPVNVHDLNGGPLTCRIGTPPVAGTATVESNCRFFYYQSSLGFVGIDSFTYIANDGQLDSNPGTVTVYVKEPDPTPLITPSSTPTSTFTATPTATATPTYTPTPTAIRPSPSPSPTPVTGPPNPLPVGTLMMIEKGVGSAPNLSCHSGSCFGMEVAPGFVVWTDFGPGTDGGIVIGKAQASGGQESSASSACNMPGEVTNAWLFFGSYGAFYTQPGGEQNIFDQGSCVRDGCWGKTDLRVWNMAWCGKIITLGGSVPCTHANCAADQKAGIFVKGYYTDPVARSWSLFFDNVVPGGDFLGVKFNLILRGQYTLPGQSTFTPTLTATVTPTATPTIGITTGPTPTATGTATYTATGTATSTVTATATSTSTSTSTFTPAPLGCTEKYPARQISRTGKQGTLTVTLTGNIIGATEKEVTICLSSRLNYQATSSKGPVVCKVKNSTTQGSGTLRINNHLKCSDKPAGKDKLHIKVKSWMVK